MPQLRGVIRPTTRAEAIQRAFNCLIAVPPPPGAPPGTLAQPIGYSLDQGQNGGQDPSAPHCASPNYGNRAWTSDCIGLVFYCLGLDRNQVGPDGKAGTADDYKGTRGTYLNCQATMDDALGPALYFEPVSGGIPAALAGDVVITPTHIELIVRPWTAVSLALTIGCSPRFDKTRKAGVGVGHPWSKDCIALRYKRFKVG